MGYGNTSPTATGDSWEDDTRKNPRGAILDNTDDRGLHLYSEENNTDPYAWEADKHGYEWGGEKGGAASAMGRYQNMGGAFAGRGAYQMDPAYENQARGYQDAAAQSYMGAMNGTQPSLAQMQMQQGLAQSNAGASGMAASARGGGANMAAAQRAAIQQQGMNSSAVAQSGAQLRAQEVNAARQGLAGVGGQMRGQDIGWQQGVAQNELGQRGLNDQMQMGYERLGYGVGQNQLAASQRYEQDRAAAEEAARQRRQAVESQNTKYSREDQKGIMSTIGSIIGLSDIRAKDDIAKTNMGQIEEANPYAAKGAGVGANSDIEQSNPYQSMSSGKDDKSALTGLAEALKKYGEDSGGGGGGGGMFGSFGGGMLGGMAGGGGGGMMGGGMMSDERVKKDFGKADLLDFADKLEPASYRYKWEDESTPRRIGVMAQDMERSRAGNSAVMETPNGKGIDLNRGLSLALASVAALSDEVKALKGRRANG